MFFSKSYSLIYIYNDFKHNKRFNQTRKDETAILFFLTAKTQKKKKALCIRRMKNFCIFFSGHCMEQGDRIKKNEHAIW
jgi:hypothetical protein